MLVIVLGSCSTVMGSTSSSRRQVIVRGASSTTSTARRNISTLAVIQRPASRGTASGGSRPGGPRDGEGSGAIQKAEQTARSETFETLATEWLDMQRNKLTLKNYENKRERFSAFVFPYLGKRPIADIKALEMLAVLKRIEERGRHETAHRVRSECGNVFRYMR